MRRAIYIAFLILILVLVLVDVANGQNFRVVSQDANTSFEIGQRAEKARRDIAVACFGRELPPWREPCVILFNTGFNQRADISGETDYVDVPGRPPTGMMMRIKGEADDTLEHEVCHLVFRTALGFKMPTWADEGIACTVESDKSLQKLKLIAEDKLSTKRGIPLNLLMMSPRYARDIEAFYSQSASLTRWLLYQGDLNTFLSFIKNHREEALRGNRGAWTVSINKFYGYKDIQSMQNEWLKWVEKGSPRIVSSADIDTSSLPFRPGLNPPKRSQDSQPVLRPAESNVSTIDASDCVRPAPTTSPSPTRIKISDELVNRIADRVIDRIEVDNGEDGRGVVSIILDEDGVITATYTDGKSDVVGRIDAKPSRDELIGMIEEVDKEKPPLSLQPMVRKDGGFVPEGDPIPIPRDGKPAELPPFGIKTKGINGEPIIQSAPLGKIIPVEIYK